MASSNVGGRVLVPLDGSPLSEAALPIAERLARALHMQIELVRIIPLETWAFSGPNGLISHDIYDQLLEDEERQTQAYLEDRAAQVTARGLSVETRGLRGVPGPALVDQCQQEAIRLVVMTTHGRTGMERLAVGSVADHVVRHSHVPVLLLRPTPTGAVVCEALDRALIPLDGSPVAEAVLALVELLAGAVVRDVTLLRVVRASEQPGADEDAECYLKSVRRRLMSRIGERGCTLETRVLHGDPADRIVQRAQAVCDLVIMATRGETGTRRWVFGSTAERVLHDCRTPLLLVRPAAG